VDALERTQYSGSIARSFLEYRRTTVKKKTRNKQQHVVDSEMLLSTRFLTQSFVRIRSIELWSDSRIDQFNKTRYNAELVACRQTFVRSFVYIETKGKKILHGYVTLPEFIEFIEDHARMLLNGSIIMNLSREIAQ
jgi:hypothetical protein